MGLLFSKEGNIKRKSVETASKKDILSTSSMSSAWPSNSLQECGDTQLYTFLSVKTQRTKHWSVYNKSVWHIPIRRSNTNKSWNWQPRWNSVWCVQVPHRREGELNSGISACLHFSTLRSSKVRFTQTNILDSVTERVLELLFFFKEIKEHQGGFTSVKVFNQCLVFIS